MIEAYGYEEKETMNAQPMINLAHVEQITPINDGKHWIRFVSGTEVLVSNGQEIMDLYFYSNKAWPKASLVPEDNTGTRSGG